VRDNEAKITSV